MSDFEAAKQVIEMADANIMNIIEECVKMTEHPFRHQIVCGSSEGTVYADEG